MARTANIMTRIEPEIKERAEAVLDQLGISMSTAMALYLKQIALQRKIPFEIGYSTPNELTARVLKETEEGKNLSPVFDSVSDLMDSLHA